jgi:hypothetical protein
MSLLASEGVASPGISKASLRQEIADLLDTADEFERLLRIVAPRIAFFVSNYADLGPAFAVACRRRRILSVRLQHSAQIWHDTYSPAAVPAEGYETLPAVYWHWADGSTPDWMHGLASVRHQSIHGGAPHLARWLHDKNPRTLSFDERVRAMRGAPAANLDVLVALQHFDGYRDIWNGLAGIIENAPANWRWWLRRKPAPDQLVSDDVFGRLLAIRRQNVITEGVVELPLPALLRNVDACVTLMSGAAVEGALFGVQPIFLCEDASGLFPQLATAGTLDIVSDRDAMPQQLTRLAGTKRKRPHSPEIVEVVERLEDLSIAYNNL